MFKSPFGAVEENKYVRLRVRLPKDCGVWYVYCLLTPDGGNTEKIEMTFEWCDNDSLYYKADLKLKSGLYWYNFLYTTENEEYYINKTEKGIKENKSGTPWQLTVYEKDFLTPSWPLGGLIYQIFPDRFYNSGESKPVIKERYLRSDWGGLPEYRQDDPYYSLGNDFFGGDIKGIIKKLLYIKSLGVTLIYLNPIFFASSNHRYNTADYEKIDPYLGDEEDFVKLCNEAHKLNIKIVLDGVFSHNGDDSKYFDRYGKNKEVKGAYQSKESPYFSWFKFENWPYKYHSWWGVPTLPEVNEDDESYLQYICSKDGILRKWIRLGADGWRLDVADELPDVFLDRLRAAVKAEKPDAFIIGEVWEDASNKISYSVRRRYFLGKQLDSVMNYPFANAIINFAKGGRAEDIRDTVETIIENYPKKCVDLLMNHIGTHDTARILTALGFSGNAGSRENQAHLRLTSEQKVLGLKRLYLAAVLQYTLPGIPSLYYGDEAGMEGFYDPFCRGCYPWGNENNALLEFYKKLGGIRGSINALKQGSFKTVAAKDGVFAFLRQDEGGTLLVALNNSDKPHSVYAFGISGFKSLIGNEVENGVLTLVGGGAALLYKENIKDEYVD